MTARRHEDKTRRRSERKSERQTHAYLFLGVHDADYGRHDELVHQETHEEVGVHDQRSVPSDVHEGEVAVGDDVERAGDAGADNVGQRVAEVQHVLRDALVAAPKSRRACIREQQARALGARHHCGSQTQPGARLAAQGRCNKTKRGGSEEKGSETRGREGG